MSVAPAGPSYRECNLPSIDSDASSEPDMEEFDIRYEAIVAAASAASMEEEESSKSSVVITRLDDGFRFEPSSLEVEMGESDESSSSSSSSSSCSSVSSPRHETTEDVVGITEDVARFEIAHATSPTVPTPASANDEIPRVKIMLSVPPAIPVSSRENDKIPRFKIIVPRALASTQTAAESARVEITTPTPAAATEHLRREGESANAFVRRNMDYICKAILEHGPDEAFCNALRARYSFIEDKHLLDYDMHDELVNHLFLNYMPRQGFETLAALVEQRDSRNIFIWYWCYVIIHCNYIQGAYCLDYLFFMCLFWNKNPSTFVSLETQFVTYFRQAAAARSKAPSYRFFYGYSAALLMERIKRMQSTCTTFVKCDDFLTNYRNLPWALFSAIRENPEDLEEGELGSNMLQMMESFDMGAIFECFDKKVYSYCAEYVEKNPINLAYVASFARRILATVFYI